MPIVERKPRAAFRRFHQHVQWLFRSTLPVPSHVRLALAHTGRSGKLEFVKGDGVPCGLPLETRHGPLFLTLTQILEAVREISRYRLRTHEYAYRLLDQDDPRANAILRWEYRSDASPEHWCRHHIQLSTGIGLGEEVLDMNRAHLPTGWVTMEEMIRFLIYELDVVPVSDSWPAVLVESERKFFEEFSGKHYKPPGARL